MKIFEKIVMSSTEPKFTNVLWLDTKDRTLKVFLNGAWTPTGSVGGVEEAPIDGNEYTRGDGKWIKGGAIRYTIDLGEVDYYEEEVNDSFENCVNKIKSKLEITDEEFNQLLNNHYNYAKFCYTGDDYEGYITMYKRSNSLYIRVDCKGDEGYALEIGIDCNDPDENMYYLYIRM